MKIELIGDWKIAKAILDAAPADLDKAIDIAVRQEAENLVGKIKRQFQKGLRPPLSSSTLLTKKSGRDSKGQFTRGGSSKPLVRSGDLRNSISALYPEKHAAFIGVPRSSARGVKLAAIHEFGKVIVQRLTEKQRRFLHAVLPRLPQAPGPGSMSTGVIVIHIPPRPFIRPVFDKEKGKIPARFQRRILEALGGKLGT